MRLSSRIAPRLASGLVSGLTAAWLIILPVSAEETDPARLKELESEIGDRVERRQALEAEADALAKEVDRIRQRLIDAAARVQARERDVTDSETRIAGLEAAQAVLLARLEARRKELTDTLAALQRLDRNPPPALAVKPDDAVSAMRSALLLSTIVPDLEADARDIRQRLEELEKVRLSLVEERETFDAASLELSEERAELNRLLEAKLTAEAAVRSKAEQEAAALARLSREASDLKDLIERLEARALSRTPAPRPTPSTTATAPEPPSSRPDRSAARESVVAALPGRQFSASRGLIRPPVEGISVRTFGSDDGAGGTIQGVYLESRPGASVTAPFDGRIAFAGPFRRYGQLLILEVGEGYHLLLAGMVRIDGVVGQNVLAGEPVGIMGETARTDDPQRSGTDKPVLYIELRRNGNPVDPEPWFVESDRKARG
ncbi:MAG: peptidoglycan DD-metalloendopeptidase family protein [Parvibaculaceae bacterium]